jgi:beta-mannosidase
MHTFDLNGPWELIERPLSDDVAASGAVAEARALCPVQVPGDVNAALASAGLLPEPLTALNFHAASARVPDRSWWYRRRFVVPQNAIAATVATLSLDGLDIHAEIWLNGVHLGHHDSAFLPFERDVRGILRPHSENVLLVRLTTGKERVEHITDFPLLATVPLEAPRGYPDRGFAQRIYLRKPAYTWGWDWSPYLPTCGITGVCAIRFAGLVEFEDVALAASLDDRGNATVTASLELRRHTLVGTVWATVRLRLIDEDGVAHACESTNVLVRSGFTHLDLDLEIRRPKLWWPHGAGAQHRYRVEASAELEDGTTVEYPAFFWGLRTVALETEPGLFRFRVNGQPLFLQGGNWVPCDHLYGRTTPARLEQLVSEAAHANFNCLRVWGGGRFELDAFYDACDRHGILLWHDFMSACAPLPAHDPVFARTFMDEARYQVRRLRNRACLMLWCGNNEVAACYNWSKHLFGQHRDPAWPLYFEELPRLIAELSPHTPYWPTSPYGGSDSVNDLTVGDDHHWIVMKPDQAFWSHPEYWDSPKISIFNSEYGYGGPCCIESTREYLGTETPDLFGPVGREHTNTFYDIPRVKFSIAEHYGDVPDRPLAEYIRLGGLCQGLNLGYSLESLRANDRTWGGLFWMYNDAWGENGWTIVDYYLRRKIAYYGVKRALAPQKLVWRRGGQAFGGQADEVLLLALNDTTRPLRGSVDAGWMDYDGTHQDLRSIALDVPAFSKAVIARLPIPAADTLRHGTYAACTTLRGLDSATWRHGRHRDGVMPIAHPTIVARRRVGDDLEVTVTSPTFAHAVSFDLGGDWRFSDAWFDLLPGEQRTLRIAGGAGLARKPLAVTCVNA